jgi:tetratricopeptide (TPR) repeat protein
MSRDTLICLALGCLALLLFAPVRHHEFINYDDPAYVREPHVQRGLTPDGVAWALTTTHFANYHPLTWLSHMADVAMFGNNPAGHHLTSVALHAINAVLLYLVLRAMTGAPWASLAVATIWAIHPQRVESVAWVAERKDLLSGLFFLLSLGAYTRYVHKKSTAAYIASLVCFVLGLMSKPMIVTLPCVLLLLDLWPLRRTETWRRLLLEKVPFVLLTIGSAVITMIAQRSAGAMTAGEVYPLSLRLTNALWAYGRYVELTLWPRGLAIIYPYHGALPGTRVPPVGIAAGVALLIGVTAVGVWLWRKRDERSLLVGWLWFLGMLVPVIGIVQVGWQSMADRYSYLPQIGLLIAIIWPLRHVAWSRMQTRVIGIAVAIIIGIALTARTQIELGYWRNNITLFTRAVAVTEKNHIALSALALGYDEIGNIPAAREHYKQALAITPREPQLYYNIGRLYLLEQNWPLAEQWLRDALAIDPKHIDALINLGKVYSGSGRRNDAITTFRQAVAAASNNAVAHYDLAVELAEQGNVQEALPHFEEAIRIQPTVPELHYSHSVALRQVGQTEQAEAAYKRYAQLARRRGAEPLPNRASNPDNRPGATTTSATRRRD